jgi:hypothetical protein
LLKNPFFSLGPNINNYYKYNTANTCKMWRIFLLKGGFLMRSGKMKIFNDMPDQNILVLEDAVRSNRKIVGMYCAYSPQELILAAGALPVGLCGTRH